MARIFVIADTHFGHSNIIKFTNDQGEIIRKDLNGNAFNNVHEHDELIIRLWNETVFPEDHVYHLGDVGFTNFPYIKDIFDKLNGTKVLIKGNHDNFKLSQYMQIFKDVRAVHVLDKYVLSHVPVHPMCLDRWKGNIHGHTHEHCVESSPHHKDKRYINVCVEHTNYTPIEFVKLCPP